MGDALADLGDPVPLHQELAGAQDAAVANVELGHLDHGGLLALLVLIL
jgi:hypothetical protein